MGRRRRAILAAFTAPHSRSRDSTRNSRVPRRGFATTSTAPYSRALMAVSAPLCARLEQITTGSGCWAISFLRKVSPYHARHFHVEHDDVRRFLPHAFGGHEGIGCRRHDFNIRIARKYLAQGLPDDRGVVHNQDTNGPGSHRVTKGECRWVHVAQGMHRDPAGSGVDQDFAAPLPAHFAGRYGNAGVLQNVRRGFDVVPPHPA